MTLSGFETATFRLIAQPKHAVEHNIYRKLSWSFYKAAAKHTYALWVKPN